LESLVQQLGLSNRVIFTGPLYDNAKWSAYRDADVFVLPSQNENFGNAIAEAIACGTPVVVTDRCGAASMLKQRAGLVVPYGQETLQEAMSAVLQDQNLRAELRKGCVEAAREFSWDEPTSIMETAYLDLL